MKKRLMSTLLTVTVMASALTACVPKAANETAAPAATKAAEAGETQAAFEVNKEGLPIVNQPITYEIAASTQKNKNFKELEFFQKLETDTNVIVNWNMSSDDGWNEKKSLLFASNTLPDAFYGQDILKDVDIIKYASQGMLIPLNDMIDEYAPNLKAILDANPQYRKQITAPDGNIYSLPTINELNPTTHDKLFINKTWLDNLGLKVPETREELETVLQAFKDGDPNGNGNTNDEIPFSFRMSSSDPYNRQQGIQSLFGTFGQLDDIYHFVINDGDVVYTPMTEPYKEAISWFHSLYEKGLVDKEAFTHDFNVYVAKIQDPNKIVGMFLGWSGNATAAANKDDYVAMAPLINTNGERIWRTVDAKIISKGSFAITSKAEHPEVLMRWIDQSYDPESSLEICQGLLGHVLEKTGEGRYHQMTAIHLLHVSVGVAQISLLLLEKGLAALDHVADDGEAQRQDAQGNQRHQRADGEHHHQNADKLRHAGDDLRHALVECLRHGVHVVGDAAEHFTVGYTVKISQRHAVDLLADIPAHSVADLGRDFCHDKALDIRQHG